jgi:hypothetical protein
LLVTCLIILAATISAPVIASQIDALQRFVLPLAGAGGTYSVLSGSHLIDVSNELLLLFPGLAVLGVLAIAAVIHWSRSSERGVMQYLSGDAEPKAFISELMFSVMMFIPSSVVLIAITPELGMARDWDLFAVCIVGLHAPVIVVFQHLGANTILRKALRSILPPILATSLVLAIAWIGIQADPARSIARFESILTYDKTKAGYAYENLASHHHTAGDVQAEIRALEQAYDASRNPRFLFTLGLRYYFVDDKDRAVQTLQKMMTLTPGDEQARQSLVQMLYFMGRYDDMLLVCMEGASLAPQNPFYPFFMAKAYVSQGRTEEALAAFDACLKLDLSAEMAEEINEYLRTIQLRRREE